MERARWRVQSDTEREVLSDSASDPRVFKGLSERARERVFKGISDTQQILVEIGCFLLVHHSA